MLHQWNIILVCMSVKRQNSIDLGKILRTLPLKETWLNTSKMFQIKIDDNSSLILTWPHRHFQQNVKALFCQKYQC